MLQLDKDEYFLESLSKIKHKKYELYVVAKVLFILNDPEIEFVCQQYVKTLTGRNFVDLYFPQFKIYLKVNEDYHGTEEQKQLDVIRDREILESVGLEPHELNVYDPKTLSFLPLSLIDQKIEIFCERIRILKTKSVNEGSFSPWVVDRSRYAPEQYLDKLKISVSENVILRRQVDVLQLFGAKYKGWQRGWWVRDKQSAVWFPKLYNLKSSIWNNSLSDDGMEIIETKKDGSIIKNPPNYNIHRIVFAHYKNNFGQTVYKFTGVFETQSNLCTKQRHVHRLISTSVNLKNENILNYAQKLS